MHGEQAAFGSSSARGCQEDIDGCSEDCGKDEKDESEVPFGKLLRWPKDESTTLALYPAATTGIVQNIRNKASEEEHEASRAVLLNFNPVEADGRTAPWA